MEPVVAQRLRRLDEILPQARRELARERSEIASGDVLLEQRTRLARHRLVDALEALDEAADVVVAVLVRPDVVDDLFDRARRLDGVLLGDARRFFEVGSVPSKQSKTVK